MNSSEKIPKLVNQYAQQTVDNRVHVKELKQYLAKASPNQIALLAKASIYGGIAFPANLKLFAGEVFETNPLRLRFIKWNVSKRSPYFTAGGYALSREALATL